MNLAVTKYANSKTSARCRELGEAIGPLLAGEELMTVEQLNAWLAEPEQVAWREQKEQEAEQARLAEEAAKKAEEDAKREAEIQTLVDAGMTRTMAEAYYKIAKGA